MLAACLLVGLFAVGITSALVFTPLARRARGGVGAVAVMAAVAAGAVAAAVGLGAVATYAGVGGAALLAMGVAWWPMTRPWGAVGRMAWAAALTSGLFYLVYMADWTFRSRLGPVGTAGGMVLWFLELVAYLLGLMFLWEMVDVLATATWGRRVTSPPLGADADGLPFVSLHVPAHNEPPDMVIETLRSLLAQDYPADRFEIVMVDDNTTDPALWRPVADFAAGQPGRIRFHHLEDWPGFKSGALNFALTVTDPAAEVIGIIDADYLADPDYLRRCAPLFTREPELGFVQTPQDYRDWEQAGYYRRLYHSYAYFFAVSQSSRNERNGAIFGGTMGLIRRRALQEVGGWDEWCITEDAELSLRLLRAGWSGRHVETSFGRGVMPLTFEALKRQRFRWCFGGIQILRMHWRSLMPWDRGPDNRLTGAQRWAYLSGGFQWYGDLLGLAFSAFLLVATADLALGGGVVFRRLGGFLLVAVPLLAALNLTRSVALLRRVQRASWRDAIGAFGLWLALGWTVARASVQGALAPAGVFLRTPKTRGDASWADALRANRAEVAFAALGIAGMAAAATATHGATRWLLPVLFVVPVLGFLGAPANTVAAMRAELPDALRRRRRTERLRAWASGPLRPARLVLGVSALAGVVTLGLVVFAPAGTPAPTPNLLHEASGHGPGASTAQPKPGAATDGHRPGSHRATTTTTTTTTGGRGGGPTAPTLPGGGVAGPGTGTTSGTTTGGPGVTVATPTGTAPTAAVTPAPATTAPPPAPATTAAPFSTTTRPGAAPPTSTTHTTSGPPTSLPSRPATTRTTPTTR